MRISDAEVKKILKSPQAIVQDIDSIAEGIDDPTYEIDPTLVHEVTQNIISMPDREDMIADLKARIEAGTYHPTGDEIADTMIRRSIADRVR